MDRQERIDLILDHFENPRHRGPLDPVDVVCTDENPGCGDLVTIYLHVNGSDGIATLAFEGQGCTISQAAASMAVELLQGWTVDQIDEASPEPLLAMLGPDIAAARLRCATLAFNVVKEACRHHRRAV